MWSECVCCSKVIMGLETEHVFVCVFQISVSLGERFVLSIVLVSFLQPEPGWVCVTQECQATWGMLPYYGAAGWALILIGYANLCLKEWDTNSEFSAALIGKITRKTHLRKNTYERKLGFAPMCDAPFGLIQVTGMLWFVNPFTRSKGHIIYPGRPRPTSRLH